VQPTNPTALDSAALSRRLSELAGHEREVQVEFLRHLDEYDRRRAYLEEGYDSLWAYCQRALLLREGPAALRITAMRALRRFPMLAELLRDGPLCLTTVRLLEPLLTDENAAELIARAASKSKSEVERLVVAIQPRAIPKEGMRKLPDRSGAPSAAALPLDPRPAITAVTADAPRLEAAAMPFAPAPATRHTLQPVAEDTYSLRVTVDAAFKAELDELKALLSHKVPTGDLGAVLREAVRCAIKTHGLRKGVVEPVRKAPKKARGPQRAAASGAKARTAIPADVRRQVWKRDQGRCAWIGPDGRRCGSTWKLELHHLVEAALGGPSTVDNLALRCRGHNVLDAEATFGRAHMAEFRREQPRTGELADSSMRRPLAASIWPSPACFSNPPRRDGAAGAVSSSRTLQASP